HHSEQDWTFRGAAHPHVDREPRLPHATPRGRVSPVRAAYGYRAMSGGGVPPRALALLIWKLRPGVPPVAARVVAISQARRCRSCVRAARIAVSSIPLLRAESPGA